MRIDWLRVGCFAIAIFLAACAENKQNLGESLQIRDSVFDGQIEALPDRISPYAAMARGAKYNVDATVKNITDKINDGDVKTIARQILDYGDDKNDNILKALDFADIYAMGILTDNPYYLENNLYALSAQNLTLETLKLHRLQMMFASQQREVNRLLTQEKKVLDGLKRKYEREGYLTEQDITYRSGIEKIVDKLERLKSALQNDKAEFEKLLHVQGKDLKLNGRSFYVWGSKDLTYKLDDMVNATVDNRREMILVKEKIDSYDFAKVRRQAQSEYPRVAKVDVNGLEIAQEQYERLLREKAEKLINALVQSLDNYKSSPDDIKVKQQVYSQLCSMVLMQIEVTDYLREKIGQNDDKLAYEADELKTKIRKYEKERSLSDSQKVDLLKWRIELLEVNYKKAQAEAEKTAAWVRLHYYMGSAPLDKVALKNKVEKIASGLREYLDREVDVLVDNAQKRNKWDDGGNAWAHQDKWLEKMMDGDAQTEVVADDEVIEKTAAKKEHVAKSVPAMGSTVGKTVIQLGAYNDIDNAYDDIKEISAAVKTLNKYDIYVENANINGVAYYRMMVRPEPENLEILCKQIIAAGYECLLR